MIVVRPSLVYFAADANHNLWIHTTKDLDFAILRDQAELGKLLTVVRIEQFDTILEAISRLKKISRMSVPRRRRLVERLNPQWRHVEVELRKPVTPTGEAAVSA